MAKLHLIKTLLREKNISIRDFAGAIGITEQGLQRMIRENSMKIETLEIIANKLDISIGIFFDLEQIKKTDSDVSIAELFEIIKTQTETIRSQQRTIEAFSAARKDVRSA